MNRPTFRDRKWPPVREIVPPDSMARRHHAAAASVGEPNRLLRCFVIGPIRAILTREENRYHLSVSTAERAPSWDEIAHAWYEIVPEAATRTGAIYFPPLDQYVNLHPFTFHIYETEPDGATPP
jgi:hypothetical protein